MVRIALKRQPVRIWLLMPLWVIPKDVQDCTGSGQISSTDRNTCIVTTACTDVAGQANISGTCTVCSGISPRANVAQTACVADCGGGEIRLDSNGCLASQTACTDVGGRVFQSSNCVTCLGGMPRANADLTMCVVDDCGADLQFRFCKLYHIDRLHRHGRSLYRK